MCNKYSAKRTQHIKELIYALFIEGLSITEDQVRKELDEIEHRHGKHQD